jgi:hypothetical protein
MKIIQGLSLANNKDLGSSKYALNIVDLEWNF